jgi:hypothetical protein
MHKYEILNWKYDREFIKHLPENFVYVNGEQIDGDLSELIEVSCFFAKQFGLGGCKSITEFVHMINEEDPILLEAMQFKLSMINKIQYADEKELADIGEPDPHTTFGEDLRE